MKKYSDTITSAPPLMIGIDTLFQSSNLSDESPKIIEMKLTIFYNDNSQNRKFLTCTLKCNTQDFDYIEEVKVSINGNEKTRKVSIPKNTEVGDLIAYFRHSIIPRDLNVRYDSISRMNDTTFLYNNTEMSSQKYLQVMDCNSTLDDLIHRPLDKGVVMIRDKQNLLCALVSKVEMETQHKDFTESYLLIERISNELAGIMKNEMSNVSEPMNVVSEKNNTWAMGQNWKYYIDFFERKEILDKLKPIVDSRFFLEMLVEIKRIVNLLYINHQIFLSDKDKSILRDSATFFHKLKEIRN